MPKDFIFNDMPAIACILWDLQPFAQNVELFKMANTGGYLVIVL